MKSSLIRMLITLALGLAGCAAAPDLPADYALDAAREEGVVIVSMTLSGKPLDRMQSFTYRIREVPPRGTAFPAVTYRYDSPRQHARSVLDADKAHPRTREIVVKGLNSSESLDILEAGKPAGRLVTLRLAPGEYEIHTWRLREPGSGKTKEYAPPRDFSYRFIVKPGEAVYLGRLDLRFGERDTLRIAVENRRAEDLALLEKKHPALAAGKIISAVGAL
jgi:hypothetical protein